MLFNYRYVNHSIEKLQVYLDHLVKEVWCKADGPFSLNLLHPELQVIVEAIANDAFWQPASRVEWNNGSLEAAENSCYPAWHLMPALWVRQLGLRANWV